jgi:hypothetical protein
LHDDHATVMGLLAKRVRMTEGQLYTAVLAVAIALLLTLTGLPNARHTTVGLPGAGPVPTLATTPTTVAP